MAQLKRPREPACPACESAAKRPTTRLGREWRKRLQRKKVSWDFGKCLQCDGADAPAEREADRTARAALSGGRVEPATESATGGTPDGALRSALESAAGGGAALPDTMREMLEPRLGTALSDVRVHVDGHAHRLAAQLGAEAFTYGPDIYFRQGAYDPASQGGRETVTHEVVHTVQQRDAEPAVQRVDGEEDDGATPLAQLGNPVATALATAAEARRARGDTPGTGARHRRSRRRGSVHAHGTSTFDALRANRPALASQVQRLDAASAQLFRSAMMLPWPPGDPRARQVYEQRLRQLIAGHTVMIEEGFSDERIEAWLTLLGGTLSALALATEAMHPRMGMEGVLPLVRERQAHVEGLRNAVRRSLHPGAPAAEPAPAVAEPAAEPGVVHFSAAEARARCERLAELRASAHERAGVSAGARETGGLSPAHAGAWSLDRDRRGFERLIAGSAADQRELYEGVLGCFQQDRPAGEAELDRYAEDLVRLEAVRLLTQERAHLRERQEALRGEAGTPEERRNVAAVQRAAVTAIMLRSWERHFQGAIEQLDRVSLNQGDPAAYWRLIGEATRLQRSDAMRARIEAARDHMRTMRSRTDADYRREEVLLAGEMMAFRRKHLAGVEVALQKIYYAFPFFNQTTPEDIAGTRGGDEVRGAMARGFRRAIHNTEVAIAAVGSARIHPFRLPLAVDRVADRLPDPLAERLRALRRNYETWIALRDLGLGVAEGLLALIPVIGPMAAFVLGAAQLGLSVNELRDRDLLAQASTNPDRSTLGVSGAAWWEWALNGAQAALMVVELGGIASALRGPRAALGEIAEEGGLAARQVDELPAAEDGVTDATGRRPPREPDAAAEHELHASGGRSPEGMPRTAEAQAAHPRSGFDEAELSTSARRESGALEPDEVENELAYVHDRSRPDADDVPTVDEVSLPGGHHEWEYDPELDIWCRHSNGRLCFLRRRTAAGAHEAIEIHIPQRQFDPDAPPRGRASIDPNDYHLTPAQSEYFRARIDRLEELGPRSAEAMQARYERYLQGARNRGLRRGEVMTPEQWARQEARLAIGRSLGLRREAEALQAAGGTPNTREFTRFDDEVGRHVTARPDGRRGADVIEVKYIMPESEGQVVYDTAQMRVERRIAREDGGRHVVVISSDSAAGLRGSPPWPRPSAELASRSQVRFYNPRSRRITHVWQDGRWVRGQ